MMFSTPLYCKNRKEWRSWLEQHHTCETGVWLLFYKKHTGKPGVTYIEAVEEALCYGWIDSIMKSIDAEKHVIKFTPRKRKSIWSDINKKKALQLIKEGKMTPLGLEKIEEAKQNGTWASAYSLRKKPQLPLDLRYALKTDAQAWNHFIKFAPSYQTMYVHWVNSAKRQETRRMRINEVVRRSHQNIKPGVQEEKTIEKRS